MDSTRKGRLEFWCDGSCSHNPGPGGYAVIELENKDNKKYVNYYKYQPCDNTTNNREELKAIIHVFENFYNSNDDISILSDSAYSVNMLNNWIWTWAGNDWKNSKGYQVENLDLVKIAYDYLTKYKDKFTIIKVPGHKGQLGNELADAVASANKQKYITLCRKNNIEDF